MNNIFFFILSLTLLLMSCMGDTSNGSNSSSGDNFDTANFNYEADRFSDKRILRYQIPGFDQLSIKQKSLVYHLTEAGYYGRDIQYDMNYRYNLTIRRTFERIYLNYQGDKSTDEWKAFETYLKEVWFANGIHHHYSMDKFTPQFSKSFLNTLLQQTGIKLDGRVVKAIFDPKFDNKKVSLDASKDLLLASAVNFYDEDVTEKEANDFYKKMIDTTAERPLSYGLNSKLVKDRKGNISEKVYKVNGMYDAAIRKIIEHLSEAMKYAENDDQAHGLSLLIQYYKTGNLKIWDDYNITWVETTKGDIDYINSFIEVYNDPLGYRGSFESIVEIKDFEASQRMKTLSENAQWFEDNAPIMDEHKKENVVGVTYNVVNVAGESGDASPSTPIGVNLPNANWIRANHGSKSVSLGNITDAYKKASSGGLTDEFSYTKEEAALSKKHGSLASKLSTALHEVIGHASGKLNKGVGTPKETLKNYASTLEEARADIVGLYYIMDPKVVELGLMPSLDVGKADYDGYIRNGLMVQLQRIISGNDIEESHMRNRQLIAKWVFEKGKEDNVISKMIKDKKTYFVINDYDKLRTLFGQLMREIQRIKSEGDYEAGKALVEAYGVKVDPKLHAEVLERVKKLNIAPYSGFINPKLVPVLNDKGGIKEIKVNYPDNFTDQMLDYAKRYTTLPDLN